MSLLMIYRGNKYNNALYVCVCGKDFEVVLHINVFHNIIFLKCRPASLSRYFYIPVSSAPVPFLGNWISSFVCLDRFPPVSVGIFSLSYPAMRDPFDLSLKKETSKAKGILLTGERTLKRIVKPSDRRLAFSERDFTHILRHQTFFYLLSVSLENRVFGQRSESLNLQIPITVLLSYLTYISFMAHVWHWALFSHCPGNHREFKPLSILTALSRVDWVWICLVIKITCWLSLKLCSGNVWRT